MVTKCKCIGIKKKVVRKKNILLIPKLLPKVPKDAFMPRRI